MQHGYFLSRNRLALLVVLLVLALPLSLFVGMESAMRIAGGLIFSMMGVAFLLAGLSRNMGIGGRLAFLVFAAIFCSCGFLVFTAR